MFTVFNKKDHVENKKYVINNISPFTWVSSSEYFTLSKNYCYKKDVVEIKIKLVETSDFSEHQSDV